MLENYSLCLNDIYFLQSKSTAMVTKVAPVLATLVLAYLEERMYEQAEKGLGSHFRLHFESKNGKRKVQGVPKSQTAALPRHQEEEETDKSK